MEKENKVYKTFEYFMMALGTVSMALSVNLFLGPNGIAPGGVSGLAVVMYGLFMIPIYISNLAINIPLFIFGARYLGKKTAIRTLFATLAFTISLKYIPYINFTKDLLLASVFGGVLMGIGLGIIFYFGGTTGGTDLAGAILNKFFPHIKLSSFMMGIDVVVVILAGFVEKAAEISLYSIISLYISIKVMDMILEGPIYSKAFYIITNKSEEVADELMLKLDRGVTALKGKGMYTKEEKDVLLCVVSRAEFNRVKEIVNEKDPDAFIMIAEMMEVVGEGFSDK